MSRLARLSAVKSGLAAPGPLLGSYQVFQLTSNGTDIGVNTMAKHTLPAGVGVDLLRLRFSNSQCGSNGDLDTANPVTVVSSVGLTPTGPWWPVRCNGSHTMVLEAGADVETDPIALHVAAGGTFYSKTFLSVTAGQTWPAQHPAGTAGTDWWCSQSGTETDLSQSTAAFTATSGNRPFAPVSVVSDTLTADTARVLVIGDSISGGVGDTGITNGGFAYRALNGVLPFQRIAVSGSKVSGIVDSATARRRLVLGRGANVALVMYGTNDFTGGRTVPQIQGDYLTLWRTLRGMGIAPTACTLVPQTTSTDSWATADNQTPKAQESVRVAVNEWLRAGAPIDPTSKAAVAVGTAGALVAGATGHPLEGWFDTADAVESSRNSGKWKVTGAANYATTDGTHPTLAMHLLMAATVNTTTLRAAAA